MRFIREIVASVDPKVLEEIPRFFGGLDAALRELFQNAYRAGAESVEVRFDRNSRVLTLIDDGRGIEDPSILLRAGASGWRGDVVEPAGLGFFACLGHADKVFVASERQSRCWRLKADKSVLIGRAAVLEEAERRLAGTGTTVELWLSKTSGASDDTVKVAVERGRELYPMSIRFNGEKIEPDRLWTPDWTVETPAGKVCLGANAGICARTYTAVWEWKKMDSKAFRDALRRVAAKVPSRKVAEALVDRFAWMWFVDPTWAVRPKLPERTELLEGEGLDGACAAILRSLTGAIGTAAAAIDGLPEQVETHAELENSLLEKMGKFVPPAMLQSLWTEIWTEELGFGEMRWADASTLQLGINSEGFIVRDELSRGAFHQKTLKVRSDALNRTLNGLGFPTTVGESGTDPKLRVRGMRRAAKYGLVALVDEIEVQGVGKIPYIINPDGESIKVVHVDLRNRATYLEQPIIFAGDAKEFTRSLGGPLRELFTNVAFIHQDDREGCGDWWERDGDRGELVRSRIVQGLVEHLPIGERDGFTEAAAQAADLDEILKALIAIGLQLSNVDAAARKVASAERAEVHREVEAMEAGRKRIRDRVTLLKESCERELFGEEQPADKGKA